MKNKKNQPNFGFRVIWSDEDAAFVASCVEIDGVSALGASRAEAIDEANAALDLVLEEYEAQGVALPAPRPLPEHSGQFRLRLPKSMHARLALRAEEEGVSLNTLVLALVASGLGERAGRGARVVRLHR